MPERVARLESLRGVGAILVLLTHCFVVVPWVGRGTQGGMIRAVHVFANGHTALVIFFVISGYVLGLSLDRGASRPHNFWRFYVRRLFRIYPAHIVTLFFITALLSSFDHTAPIPESHPIFLRLFPPEVTLVDFVMNALLLKVNMNGLAWSLAVEMGISIVFPVLYLISRRWPWWAQLAVLLGLIGLSFSVGTSVVTYGHAFIVGLPGSVVAVGSEFAYAFEIVQRTSFYGYIFFIGLTAGPVFEKLIPKIEGRLGSTLLWLALLMAVSATVFTFGKLTPAALLVRTIGASFVVFGAVFMQQPNLIINTLDRPFFMRLGTISYSFYLYHLVIYYAVAQLLFRLFGGAAVTVPFFFDLVLAILTFGITFPIAATSYRFIEAPFIKVSRKPGLGIFRRRTGP